MHHEEITHEKLYQAIKNNSLEIRHNKVEANTKFDKLFKLYFSLDKRLDFLSSKLTIFEIRLTGLEEMLAPFPNLMDKVDRLIGEIVESREERVVTTARLEDHEKRLTILEAK